ncbi:MAG: hypothetical protein D6757_09445 [Alphaproteobacteria bacterium]|nr:MAG: hypothetical protein D6757_09445 [Alphaproteobacteria bacterium]
MASADGGALPLSPRGRRRQHRHRRRAGRFIANIVAALLIPIGLAILAPAADAGGERIVSVSSQASGVREILRLNGPRGIDRFRDALRRGELQRAEELARNAFDQARGRKARAGAFTRLCVVHRLQDRLKEARAECDTAVRLTPHDWRAYLNRAALAIEQGDFTIARTDLRRADRLSRGEPVVAANRRILAARRKAERIRARTERKVANRE